MSLLTNLMPLQCLRTGQHATVGHLTGDSSGIQRLKELGLREGAHVEMISAGDACIIRLSGHKLCLRAGESAQIFVEPGRGW